MDVNEARTPAGCLPEKGSEPGNLHYPCGRRFGPELKKSGEPAVLTVNGQAEVVIQSAGAYQKLLDDQQLPETIRGVSRGLEQVNRGEGRPIRKLIEELAGNHRISLV